MLAKERYARGRKCWHAKLTEADVAEIRRVHSSARLGSAGTGYTLLGRRFGVSGTTVRAAVTRRTWRHV
jgi:hypothetical protein